MMELRIIKLNFWISAILVLGLSGCYYDVEEILYPGGCRVNTVTYSETIIPILERYCYTCHNTQSQEGGINLEGYSNVIVYVQNGSFLGAVKHEEGFSPMPDGQPMLDDCTILKIETWINDGAPDN